MAPFAYRKASFSGSNRPFCRVCPQLDEPIISGLPPPPSPPAAPRETRRPDPPSARSCLSFEIHHNTPNTGASHAAVFPVDRRIPRPDLEHRHPSFPPQGLQPLEHPRPRRAAPAQGRPLPEKSRAARRLRPAHGILGHAHRPPPRRRHLPADERQRDVHPARLARRKRHALLRVPQGSLPPGGVFGGRAARDLPDGHRRHRLSRLRARHPHARAADHQRRGPQPVRGGIPRSQHPEPRRYRPRRACRKAA